MSFKRNGIVWNFMYNIVWWLWKYEMSKHAFNVIPFLGAFFLELFDCDFNGILLKVNEGLAL